MAEKDITEKLLEDYNDVFADIVNGLLFNGKPVIEENSLVNATPRSMYKIDNKVHEQERDTAKYWQKQNHSVNIRLALIGIENQTTYYDKMPVRILGYDGASYRAQLNSSLNRLYPVLTLVLYFGKERWKNRRLSDIIDLSGMFQPYLNDYKINVFEIAYLTEEQLTYFHSDFRIVADYFVHSRDNPDYRPINPQKFRHVDELLKLMSVLTQDKRFEEVANISEKEELHSMDKVLDYREAIGEARGIAIGESRGIAIGEARQAEKTAEEKRRADAALSRADAAEKELARYKALYGNLPKEK